MQEYLLDGVKRDRLVWASDMPDQIMTILSVFGQNEVIPKSLDHVRDETPADAWINGVPAYSMWWVLQHYSWYMYTGDFEYLSEQKGYLIPLLNKLTGYIDRFGGESLPGMRIPDWPSCLNKGALHAGLHAMLFMSLERGAYLASLLGNEDTAARCRQACDRMRVYVPSHCGSKQAAALLVYSGLANAEEINQNLLSVGGAKGFSTFLGFYTLAAKALAGDCDGALKSMRQYWGGMIKLGATTFWENFEIDWLKNGAGIDELTPKGKKDIHFDLHENGYNKFRQSLCHGRASGPVPFLTRYILGINVLEPGCKKIKIEPHMGDLFHTFGTFPTKYGDITIENERRIRGKTLTTVNAPKDIEVILPE